MRDKRAIIERHLLRVQPQLRGPELARRLRSIPVLRPLLRGDVSFAVTEPAPDPKRHRRVGAREHLYERARGWQGVILALPHLGGWEWLVDGWPIRATLITVVRRKPLEPPELPEWFAGLRESLGMHVIPRRRRRNRGHQGALKANTIVCLLSDRDIGGGGVSVEFFGERTRLPAGPSSASVAHGCAGLARGRLLHDAATAIGGSSRPPLAERSAGNAPRRIVARATQALAHELEGLIRRAPTQWHLFQPNWPSDPRIRGLRFGPADSAEEDNAHSRSSPATFLRFPDRLPS